MPQYGYVAKSGDGRVVRASVNAVSRHAALSQLYAEGLTVVDLYVMESGAAEPAAAAPAAPRMRRRLRPGFISMRDKAVFCRQLAISVNAGLPLRDALESIAEDTDNPSMQRILLDVTRALHDGKTFSEAIAPHRVVFSSLFVALIRVAEEAGSMARTLNELSTALENSDRLARKIRSILAYPAFVAVFFVIVCLIMTLFIVPQFQRIFGTFEARLPLFTRMVFRVNELLIRYFPLILLAAVALAVAFWLLRRTPAGRVRLDRMKLKIPLFGPCLRKLIVARICRNLAIMIRGGVPIASAIEIAAGIAGNRVLEKALGVARDRIIAGADIASSLGGDPEAFPRLVVRMVAVGEASGQLPEVLDKVSEGYEDEVENSIMTSTSLFEPIIICVFGMVVLVLVLAIYLPIFTVATHMK